MVGFGFPVIRLVAAVDARAARGAAHATNRRRRLGREAGLYVETRGQDHPITRTCACARRRASGTRAPVRCFRRRARTLGQQQPTDRYPRSKSRVQQDPETTGHANSTGSCERREVCKVAFAARFARIDVHKAQGVEARISPKRALKLQPSTREPIDWIDPRPPLRRTPNRAEEVGPTATEQHRRSCSGQYLCTPPNRRHQLVVAVDP